VILGSINPLSNDLAFDEQYFLGIQVDTDSEMVPRQTLTSVGYALNSVHAQNADNATNAQNAENAQNANHANNADNATNAQNANHANTADTVVDGAITLSKLDPTECSDGEVFRRNAVGWECSLLAGGPPGPQGDPGEDGAPGVGLGDIQNLAIVIKGFQDGSPVVGPGIYLDPLAALNDLPSWCPTPSQLTPCLIKIMPGVYDIPAVQLFMVPFVDFEGSGEHVTKIRQSPAQPNLDFVGTPDVEIRDLTIEGTNAQVSFQGTAATSAQALSLSHATLEGGAFGGVIIFTTGALVMNDVTVRSDGVDGINNQGFLMMRDSTVETINDMGVTNLGEMTLSDVRITGDTGAIRNLGFGTMKIDRSEIHSVINPVAVEVSQNSTTQIGTTKITGSPILSGMAVLTCVHSYTGVYTELDSVCLPIP